MKLARDKNLHLIVQFYLVPNYTTISFISSILVLTKYNSSSLLLNLTRHSLSVGVRCVWALK